MSFYQPILANLVLPHAVFFGYLVGVVELFIGVCLLLGIWVRPASVLGALHMLSLTLATWWEPGQGIPVWRYFGSELDHLPLLFLFIIFFVADAGKEWGLDGRRRGKSEVEGNRNVAAVQRRVSCAKPMAELRLQLRRAVRPN